MAPRTSDAGPQGISKRSFHHLSINASGGGAAQLPSGYKITSTKTNRAVGCEWLESRTLLSTYSVQTLLSLGGNSGIAAANGSLVVMPNDTVYGTTPRGGIDLSGSIFALPKGAAQVTTLAYFGGGHGSDPAGGLVMDAAGNLYGTTVYTTSGLAGNNSRPTGSFGAGDGTIFELAKGSKAITTLATFDGTNGQSPEGTLVIDAGGNLYGTTRTGGANGDGTVFELPSGSASIVTLASFDGTNGKNPISPLLIDSADDVFGTTPVGGSNGDGVVFEIPASGSVTTLASFSGANGASPLGGLIEDASGNLFGSAGAGGANNEGNVYEIASGSGTITPIASFAGIDGSNPQGELAMDASGDLFGTAHLSGAADDGTVFEVVSESGAITTIAAFNGPNGSLPQGLAADGNGNYFTLASAGGTFGLGTVDRVLLGGTANTPGRFTAVLGQTTLPTAVVGGQIVDSTVTVGLTDALPVNGLVTIRLYASSDGAVDSASSLVRTFESPVNIKAGVQFAINVPIVSLPTTLPSGFYRLLAQATDPFGNVAITASGPGVEIAAPAVAFSGTLSAITLPAQSISGLQTPAMATLLLSNDGNIPSQGPVIVQLYLSPDGTVANGTAIRAAARLLYLLPGTSTVIRLPLGAIPAGLAGSYFLVAQVSGPRGATATVSSASSYTIAPGAAAISARIDSFRPATINSAAASSFRGTLSLTLTNTGNIPAGGPSDPFMVSFNLTTGDGMQSLVLQNFASPAIVGPGRSKTIQLRFRNGLLASPAAGMYFPTIFVNPIAGSLAASATGAMSITVE
jgi:uncharacterized repeat protein (TIGR03803 family)